MNQAVGGPSTTPWGDAGRVLPLAGDAGLVRAVERSRAWALGEQKGCRDSFPQRPIPEMSWALPAPVDCGRIAGGLQEQGGRGLRDDDVPSGYGLRAPSVGLVSLGPPRERDPGNGGRSGAQSCHPRLSSPARPAQRPIHPTGPGGPLGCYCLWWLRGAFTYLLIYFASQTRLY